MVDGSFPRGLLLNAYGFAWSLARPVLRRNKRMREGFSWRLVPDDWSGFQSPEKDDGVDVWIQAASGGEAYLVWELLKRLPEALVATGTTKTAETPLQILVTTWTRQGLEVLHGMATTLSKEHPELSIRVTFFPLDAPSLMSRALDQARPKVVALLETELWPGLLFHCARRDIPVLVLNGRMTEKSAYGYRLLDVCARGFWKSVTPAHITAISSMDAARFGTLFGEDRVEFVPNIKFDRAIPQLPDLENAELTEDAPLANILPSALHQGRTILLASTREEEEEALISTIRRLRTIASAPTIIVAPRHMHRVDAWRKKLEKASLPVRFRSEWNSETPISPAPSGSLLVWDAFGELNKLYKLADAVFVGGSLAPLGGQNFLEPLALGKIPCCGPHLKNFNWALLPSTGNGADSLETLSLLRRCWTAKTLAHLLQNTLEHPAAPAEVRERFAGWLKPRLGGSLRCALLIAERLKK